MPTVRAVLGDGRFLHPERERDDPDGRYFGNNSYYLDDEIPGMSYRPFGMGPICHCALTDEDGVLTFFGVDGWRMYVTETNGECDSAGEQVTSCSFAVKLKFKCSGISSGAGPGWPTPSFNLALDAVAVAAGVITYEGEPAVIAMEQTVTEHYYDLASDISQYDIDMTAEFTVVPGCDADYELTISASDLTIDPISGPWLREPGGIEGIIPGSPWTIPSDIGVLFLCSQCDTSKPTGTGPAGGKNANDQSVGNATVAALETTAEDSDEETCGGCWTDGPYYWNPTGYTYPGLGEQAPGWVSSTTVTIGESIASIEGEPEGTWTPASPDNTNRPSPRTATGFSGTDAGTTSGGVGVPPGLGSYEITRIEFDVVDALGGKCIPDSVGGCVASESCWHGFRIRAHGSYVSNHGDYKGPELDYGPSAGHFWKPTVFEINYSRYSRTGWITGDPDTATDHYSKTPGTQTGPDVEANYVTQCTWEWSYRYGPGCGSSAEFEVGANHFSPTLDASTKTDATPARVILLKLGCYDCNETPTNPNPITGVPSGTGSKPEG